jgi:hypothetical protein
MSELALRTLLNNLEACRSSLHGRLHVFTFLVVVGLGFDLFVILKEFWDDLQEFRYGQANPTETHLPKKPSVALLVLALVGTVLIVFGVAGELYVDVQAGKIETQIREANDTLLGLIIQEAGTAKSSAEGAANAAGRAKDASDDAISKAANAQLIANSTREEAERLKDELAVSERRLAAVDAKRAELEQSLMNFVVCTSPRVIPRISYTNSLTGETATPTDPLKRFSGRGVIIEFLPNDAETRRAAYSIRDALHSAGWNIVKVVPGDNEIKDGVEVQAYLAKHDPQRTRQEWDDHLRSQEVVDALVDFLHLYNWQALSGWPPPENDIPLDGIKVRVGLYPAVMYVAPPGAQGFSDAILQVEQEMQESSRQREEQAQKREDEQLKQSGLTPQQIAVVKAREQETKKEQQKWMARYTQPCRPLTPLSLPTMPLN